MYYHNIMIIDHGKTKEQCICGGKCDEPDTMGSDIRTFFNARHAIDAGWRVTKHKDFCPPEKDYVWICPDCAAKYQMKGLSNVV